MAFEQLSSLRDKLAQQAATEKALKKQKQASAGTSAQKSSKVDPLVLVIGMLQKKFPLAFPKKPASKVPLKIGIHRDILEQAEQLGIDKKDIRAAIKTWCWGNRYWECMLENAARVDLNGNAVGQVTKVDAEQAELLKKRRQKKPKPEVQPSEGVQP